MRKNRIRIWTMIMGIITALVIVFSQLFFYQNANYSKKEIKKGEEQKEQNSSDETYITPPSVSQSFSTHVEGDQKSSYLFEILFEEDEVENKPIEIPRSLGKFFHTLFRVIISPNAP